ncbi:MAG: GNAT family N-acetyltransferase [Rikenellaceae bacterium]|nr:GNAT family N-acetyltransferase [Rikenellaceae bacterium]
MHTADIGDGFTLREAEMADAEAIWRALDSHRDYLAVWLPFVPRITRREDEEAFLRATLDTPCDARNIVFVIERDGAFCGLAGYVKTDRDNNRTEIGYWLLPEFQGRGAMTRAVAHLCRRAAERGMNRIQIRCAAANGPSNAIPRRLGFVLEGTERAGELLASGEYADINVYSILKNEIERWKNPS